MSHEVTQKLQAATCSIRIWLNDECISHGSGFSFLPSGEVITAAHVVTGRAPLREEDFSEPGLEIRCKFRGIPARNYKVGIRGLQVHVPGFNDPIDIDFSILVPEQPIGQDNPYLQTLVHAPKLGDTVYAAGFSDEIELPFEFNRILSTQAPGSTEFLSAMRDGYEADMLQLMCKRAMVGNIRRFVFSTAGRDIGGELYYLDNAMHSGASGGPVVNENAQAVGVITQRATTPLGIKDAPDLKVPSGSTLVLSLGPLLAFQENDP